MYIRTKYKNENKLEAEMRKIITETLDDDVVQSMRNPMLPGDDDYAINYGPEGLVGKDKKNKSEAADSAGAPDATDVEKANIKKMRADMSTMSQQQRQISQRRKNAPDPVTKKNLTKQSAEIGQKKADLGLTAAEKTQQLKNRPTPGSKPKLPTKLKENGNAMKYPELQGTDACPYCGADWRDSKEVKDNPSTLKLKELIQPELTNLRINQWLRKNVPFPARSAVKNGKMTIGTDIKNDLAQYAPALEKEFGVKMKVYGQKNYITVEK